SPRPSAKLVGALARASIVSVTIAVRRSNDWACMMIAVELQPDQRPALWDEHLALYEEVFEPLTLTFAARAIDRLDVAPGDPVIDIAAGCGGAALMVASRGADVLAGGASARMGGRIHVPGAGPPAVRPRSKAHNIDS